MVLQGDMHIGMVSPVLIIFSSQGVKHMKALYAISTKLGVNVAYIYYCPVKVLVATAHKFVFYRNNASWWSISFERTQSLTSMV